MRHNGMRGYAGYRGRRSGKKRGWLIALLLLILLAAGVFLFAQRYKVYRSDGSSRYEFPWTRVSEAPAPAAQELEIVVEPKGG